MLTFIGHAGEEHPTVVDEASHLLITEWYVALPLLLAGTALLGLLVFRLSRSLAMACLAVAAALLIIGVSTYSLSPAVSIVALSTGFTLILFQVLTELRGKR